MLYKWSRFSKIWSVKLFRPTFALTLRLYLSPAYLSPRYSITSPFSKFRRCSTSPSKASHLCCERSFTKLKIILSYIQARSTQWSGPIIIESLRNKRPIRSHTCCSSIYCSCHLRSYTITRFGYLNECGKSSFWTDWFWWHN